MNVYDANGDRSTTMAEDAAERDIRARWSKDSALRAEFVDDFPACVAYHMAVARGVAKHTRANVVTSIADQSADGTENA